MDEFGVIIIFSLIIGLICGCISRSIASSRGMEGGFGWGFFLGIIGVIIVALKPNDQSKKVSSSINASNNIDDLKKLAQLKEQGVISEEEFSKMKSELLNKIL